MSTLGGRGGGGAGFGGFPYRGAHEQGADGAGGGRRRRTRRRRRRKGAPLIYGADISIRKDSRARLIGARGSIIRQLTEETESSVHVPKKQPQQQRGADTLKPVYVKSPSIACLLHACWRISEISMTDGEVVDCKIRIPNSKPIAGQLERHHEADADDQTKATPPFWSSEVMSAFVIKLTKKTALLSEEQIETIVDNERFADSTITAEYEAIALVTTDDDQDRQSDAAVDSQDEEVDSQVLVFVYGTTQQFPERLYQKLHAAFEKLEEAS